MEKKTAKLFKVLGNEYRVQIIGQLMAGEKNVSTLNKSVKVSQPALSQHLSKLRASGIIKARRDQRQIFYSIASHDAALLLDKAREMVGA